MASLLAAVALLAAAAAAVPSPQSLNSSLTILINNDLQGNSSKSSTSGVILLSRRSYDDAVAGCRALGEELWSPELGTASIQPNLDYLVHQGQAEPTTLFWIAAAAGDGPGSAARATSAAGLRSGAPENPPRILLLPALCAQTAPYSSASSADAGERWQVSVRSNGEDLVGFRDRVSFRFLGVRYAPQPRRFAYPVAHVGSGGTVPATRFGSQCVQGTSTGSEDCLFLNIFTPHLPQPGPGDNQGPKKAALKPVMFWIHGGAFTGGSGSDATMDGGSLASRGDVVLVTINYRLTTLGFLALDDDVTRGNFGLADQVAALDWVRAHVRDFGGDPDRITIFGQSAGAASVRALMGSPRAAGKFAAAIPLSNLGGLNYGTTYSRYYTVPEEVKAAAAAILRATNCTAAPSQVDCLRAVPAYTLSGLSTVARYLVVDGTYVTSPELPLTTGDRFPFALMMGIMRDDGAPFIQFPTTDNESDYLASVGFQPPPPALFPIPRGAAGNTTLDLYNMSSRLATDGIFRCVDQATAHAGLRGGRFGEVYYYEFDRSYQTGGWPGTDVCNAPKTRERPDGDPKGAYFKCHSGELYYVFGNLARQGRPLRDEDDLPFQQFVLDTFASFARTYDPNPDEAFLAARGYASTLAAVRAAGRWKPATRTQDTMRVMDWPPYQGPFREGPQCDALGLGLDYYGKK